MRDRKGREREKSPLRNGLDADVIQLPVRSRVDFMHTIQEAERLA